MPWWVPQIHAHASLVLGTGIYALLHLQSWADAQLPRSEAGSAGAMALLAASWLACTWLCFLLVKTTLLVPIMLLPAIIVGKLAGIGELRNQFFRTIQTARRVTIPANGASLDAVVIMSTVPTSRWAIWTNANGVPYEQNLPFLQNYGQHLGVNVLTFNYRGVGDSTGWPFVAEDLVDDTIAAIEFLKSNMHATTKNMLVHGHSMGGGVLGHVAAKYPDVLLVSDRSFRSLTAVAKAFMVHLGTTMSVLLGIILGVTFSFAHGHSRWAGESRLQRCIFFGAIIGYFVGRFTPLMQTLAPLMLKYAGWELDVAARWPSTRTLCIFHPRDEVIHYELSSLHMGLPRASEGVVFRSLGIYASHQQHPHHMYQLDSHAEEWRRIVAAINALMQEFMEPL